MTADWFQPTMRLPPLAGYGVIFSRLSCRRSNGRRLLIHPRAFDNCLASRPNIVVCRFHNLGCRIASTGEGRLLIDPDAYGLWIIALPVSNEVSAGTVALVSGGHCLHMSASMRIVTERIIPGDNRTLVHEILEADLLEISITADPGLPGTAVRVVDDPIAAGVCGTPATLRLAAERLHRENSQRNDHWQFQKSIVRRRLLNRLAYNDQDSPSLIEAW